MNQYLFILIGEHAKQLKTQVRSASAACFSASQLDLSLYFTYCSFLIIKTAVIIISVNIYVRFCCCFCVAVAVVAFVLLFDQFVVVAFVVFVF